MAIILKFPPRGRFADTVHVERERGTDGWITLFDACGSVHGNFADALREAHEIAASNGLAVVSTAPVTQPIPVPPGAPTSLALMPTAREALNSGQPTKPHRNPPHRQDATPLHTTNSIGTQTKTPVLVQGSHIEEAQATLDRPPPRAGGVWGCAPDPVTRKKRK